MRSLRSTVFGMLAIAVVVVAATACGATSTSTKKPAASQAPSRVDEVRLAGGQWGYPSPFATSQAGPAQANTSLLFDNLVWLDSKGNVIPWLATKWSVSADGTEWTFTLRQDVKWHDGQPLTADDVVFTYQYSATGPGKNGSLAYNTFAANGVTGVRATGTYTVVFTTSAVNATFLKFAAATTPIVPRHVWQSVSDPLRFRDASAVMGSGPYTLAAYDEAQGAYLFQSYDSYWHGPPFVQRIAFVPAADQVLALRQGELDLADITQSAVTDATLNSFDPAKYSRISAPGQTDVLIMIGMTRGFPYNDVRFRQALAYAMNRQDMLQRLFLGRGSVASMGMLEPANSQWVPKDLPTYAYSPSKAAALLDQVGLKLGSDGLRHLPNGQVFRPQMLAANTLSAATAQLTQEYLLAVGIQVDVKTLDRTTLNAATTQGNYDLALMSYGISWDPQLLRANLSSRATKTWWNAQGWNNTAADDLMDLQNTQLDTAKRIQTTQQLERIIANDVPVLPLVAPSRMAIFDKTAFHDWYYTVGGGPIYPFLVNRLVFVTGGTS